MCFGQPVDIEILTLLHSKIDEVSEAAVQTWMLKENKVLKLFCVVPIQSVTFYTLSHASFLLYKKKL